MVSGSRKSDLTGSEGTRSGRIESGRIGSGELQEGEARMDVDIETEPGVNTA
jgi:hypothetical protein